jgi:hypothetical protein
MLGISGYYISEVNSSKSISKVKLRFSGNIGGQIGQGS